ncbi:hypothetical protein [Paenirhodobacter sp.]|uniref:hypothetical protein n=1 Tax=Paenirhodobacter sp. TaxID=1965326 RepID=UPI003B40BE84
MDRIRIARWTPAWFATGAAMLIAALLALLTGHGTVWEAGETRAILHLLVLGWVGTVMIGALLQFVPVLAAAPLAWPGLAPVVLALWAAGVLSLSAGFWADIPQAMAVAAALLPLATAMALAMLIPPVLAALRRERLMLLLAVGLAGMAGAVAMGAGFALSRAGGDGLPLLPEWRAVHASLGLGLWLSFTAMAVSLKFLAMFGLAPAAPNRALTVMAIGAVLAVAVPLAAPLVVAVYVVTVVRMLRARRLPRLDPSLRGALGAGVALVLAALLPGVTGGMALVLGWLSGLTLAFLPKILAFLTWIEVFGPRIGHAPVPATSALSDGRQVLAGLALWALGVALMAAGVMQAGAGVLLCAAAIVLCECLRVRRLSHLPADDRPPHPSLFLIQP